MFGTKRMKKRVSSLLVFVLLITAVISNRNDAFAKAALGQGDVKNLIKMVEQKDLASESIVGNLMIKLNFSYPEKIEALDKKKVTMEVISNGVVWAALPLMKETIHLGGTFRHEDKEYSYQMKALNEEGIPITTESEVSYINLEIYNLPEGDYSVGFKGIGYTSYETKKASIKNYSQEIVVNTDSAGFLIGDVNGDQIVDGSDRKLVEERLSIKNAEYDFKCDLNQDNVIDIVDLALVNRHIGIPVNGHENEIFQTSLIVNAAADVNAISQSLLNENKTVTGKIENLFLSNEETVKIEQGEVISKENALSIPVAFREAVETSQITIDTPHNISIEQGSMIIMVTEDGVDREISYPINNTQPAGVHAITAQEGKNTVIIELGKKVAVKKVTIRVEKVTDANGAIKYVAIDEIKFIRDIVPENPKSDQGVVKNIKVKNGSNEVLLSWDSVANITGYKIYISEKSGNTLSDYIEVDTVNVANATVKNIADKKLKNYQNYYFVVTSINDQWQSGISKEVVGTPQPNKAPLRPDNVKITEEDQFLAVSWKVTEDADSYHVYYKKSTDEKFQKATEKPIVDAKYSIGGLENNVLYQVYVTALNPIGESGASLISEGTPHKAEIGDPGIPRTNQIKREGIESIALSHKNSVDMTQYPNGFDINNVIDGDFTTHWTARTWWDENAIITTFKEPHEMDFITFVPRLDGLYKTSPAYYTIKVWEENDDLSKPGKVLFTNKSMTLLNSKEENNDGRYAILTFPKTRVKKISTAIKIWDGARANPSMSEIVYYDYYSLVDEVEALFQDETFTALQSGVNLEKITKLRAKLNDKDSYYIDSEILAGELELAESLLPGNTSKVGKVLDGVQSMGGFQPLGVSAVTANKFVIYASIPDGETVELIPTQYFAEASAWRGQGISLVNGRNVIEMPKIHNLSGKKGGSVYFRYQGKKADEIRFHVNTYVKAAKIQDQTVRFIPVLELYNWDSMTEEQRNQEILRYIKELKQYKTTIYDNQSEITNATEISLPHVLLSIPASTVLKGILSFGQEEQKQAAGVYENTLAWEELMHIMYTTNGVAESSIPNETRENIRYMRMFGKAFMFAAGSYVGVGYGSTQALMMGQSTKVTGENKQNNLFGWGIAHEIGHNKDTLGLAEITNNIYSLFSQTQDGRENALTSRVPFTEVFQKTAKGVPGFSNNVFVQLGMYWQLHLAYDDLYRSQEDNFYYKVNQKIKAKEYAEYPMEDRFAIIASEVADKNLTEFFTRWGMKLSDPVKAEIAKNKEIETRAIYYLNDESRAYRMAGKPDIQVGSGSSITAKTEIRNTNEVLVSWDYDTSLQEGLQGFELYRNGKAIAFVPAVSGETSAQYIDVLGAANNLAYIYSIAPVSKLGTVFKTIQAGEVKISHDAVIDRSLFEYVKEGDTITVTMKQPQSISGIRISNFDAGAVSEGGFLVEVKQKPEDVNFIPVKTVDWKKNETQSENKFINYFNKPGTDGSDTRIWTYDTSQLKITGLPEGISMDSIDFMEYPGDNIDIVESQIGIMGEDYVFDAAAGEEGILKKGTLVITGNYRGDPVYNTISLLGMYDVSPEDKNQNQQVIERPIDGYSLLFAEVPDIGEVSEISDGFWIFVPDVQREAELQELEKDNCWNSILPLSIKAELYRTDDPNSSDSKRLVSNTLWMASPSYESMPEVILHQN